ncbi:hypothetical protein [Plasmodium yoelii yoelii]|uniref:Rab-GAP TBC domain-containing protein n=1 Tax=Plasmodium yoelii yoelii TaxID=73239 RepID=Q7RRJ2_PLAYO|nr:hypothetical protein [Plasmodium yoelii yoelii]
MVPSFIFIIIFSDDEYDHYGFEKSREAISVEDIDKEALEKRKRKIEKKYYTFLYIKRQKIYYIPIYTYFRICMCMRIYFREYILFIKMLIINFLCRWQQYFTVKRDIKKNYYLKKLIRKGIPDKFRMNIWPYLLGSVVLYTKYPTIYERCLNSEIEPKVLSQIELDMLRTFPHNKNYQLNAQGLTKLRNVLRAFAIYKPKINYCQSMNFIAAITLLFLKEELAFWSIVQLIDSDYSHKKINISDYYNHEMRGLRRDIIVIEELIKIKFPNIYMHMKEFDVDVSWICSEWLLCLFCTAFPITTTLRIWDCLFYEGDKILFRIVLALFKMNQEKLIKSNSLESILYLFKESTKNMVESDKLMHTAFKEIGSLKKKKIKKLRMKADDIIKRTVP